MNLERDESTSRDQIHGRQVSELLSPLDLFIRDLDEKKGNVLKAPCCQKVIDIQTSVENVLKTLLLKVQEEQPFYQTTLINSGSFYEGTKVGQPNEFDYFVQLDNFSEPTDILFDELPGSIVIVVPSESGFEKLTKFIRYPNFDWKISVKTPFVRALNKVATEFEGAYGIKVLSSASKTNGPAYSLELEWSGGERYREPLKISVDLSLAVKIHSRSSTLHPFDVETPAGKVITSLLDSLPYYYAVSAYNHGLPDTPSDLFKTFKASASTGGSRSVEERHVSLRCSQSCLEQALFLHFGPEGGPTVCLRVLKILRDLLFPNIEVEDFAFFRKHVVTSHWSFLLDFGAAEASDLTVRMWMYQSNLDVGSYIKQYVDSKWISSYALKTLVLLEWEQNPTDEEWAGSNLSRRLLNILKRLHHSLTRHELCSFFYRDYKIFPCINVFLYEKAIIGRMSILQSLLLSMRDQSKSEYKFEECFENFLKDLKWTCQKVKLYNFLLNALQDLFDHQLKEAEEGLTVNAEESFADLKQMKTHLCSIYNQSLLEKIATEVKLILPELERVADTARQRNIIESFKEITCTRMRGLENMPSFNLPLRKFERQDELAKLLNFLYNIFANDVQVLVGKL